MEYGEIIRFNTALERYRLPRRFGHGFDKWVCSSALQKSIRRGYLDTALLMTRAFLDHDPDYFWRRINTIALEDVGIGDLELVNQVLWVSGKVSVRAKIGEAEVAAYIVSALCEAPKDRNGGEIPQALERHPRFVHLRERSSWMSFEELIVLARSGDMYEATMATWALFGTKRYASEYVSLPGFGDERVIEALKLPDVTADMLRLSRSKPAFSLPVGIAGLIQSESVQTTAQEEPCNSIFHGIYPVCAFDKHTRLGKQALRFWVRHDSVLRDFFDAHVPAAQYERFAGLMLFAIETENVSRRVRYAGWEEPLQLSTEGALCSPSFTPDQVQEVLQLGHDRLQTLNEIRQCLLDPAGFGRRHAHSCKGHHPRAGGH